MLFKADLGVKRFRIILIHDLMAHSPLVQPTRALSTQYVGGGGLTEKQTWWLFLAVHSVAFGFNGCFQCRKDLIGWIKSVGGAKIKRLCG